MTTYTTNIFSEEISITGNFSDATSPVSGDISRGYQVAAFRHSPAMAMRTALVQLVIASGDSPEDFADEIDDAVCKMRSS